MPEPPALIQPEAATAAELIPALTDSVGRAKRVLGGFDDARMLATWRLQTGGQDILVMTRVALVRAIMLNWYHHRGQLLVYLRRLGLSVPSVYGPTADESPFAVATTTTTA